MCGSLEPLRRAAQLRGGLAGLDRAGFAGLALPGAGWPWCARVRCEVKPWGWNAATWRWLGERRRC